MRTPVSFAAALASQAEDGEREYKEGTNGRILLAALNEAELKYETLEVCRYRIPFKDMALIVSYSEEHSVLSVVGYTDISMPETKWPQAYELINKLNEGLIAQCFMDKDGDLKACQFVDTDNTRLSVKMVHASIGRVTRALSEGREQMLRLRFT